MTFGANNIFNPALNTPKALQAVQNPVNSAPLTRPESKPATGLKTDTTEFSNKPETKNVNNKKKFPLWSKILMGLGITAASIFAIYKLSEPTRAQRQVSELFLKDVTKKEAMAIKKKYKAIAKISDKDEFIDKMFSALKKDYDLDDIPIRLDKTLQFSSKTNKSQAIEAVAVNIPDLKDDKQVGELIMINKSFGKEEISRSLAHELRHSKQNKLQFQASTREEIEAMARKRIKNIRNSVKNLIKQGEKVSEEEMCLANEASFQGTVNNFVNMKYDFYENLGIKHIDKTDKNYEWAKKILKSYKTNANASLEAYASTFYETDALNAEYLIQKLCGFLPF